MLKIWGRGNSTNVQKVLWLCDELGLDFERVDAGGPFGGLDQPAYRRLNPNGLVPTIDHDGFVLWESHAILRYLASTDPARRFYPADIRDAATIDKWMDWQVISLAWQLRTLFMLAHRPGDAPAGDSAAAATAKISASLALLDRHLEENAFMAGKDFSIADIPIGISVQRWRFLSGSGRDPYAALDAWYGKITERPGFKRIAATKLP